MIFTKEIDTDRPIPVYNNQVITYYDELPGNAVKSIITVGAKTFTLYPDQFSNFYFNFREVFMAVIQTDYLVDSLDLSSAWLHTLQPGYLEQLVNIEIQDDLDNVEDVNITYKLWRAALQLEEYRASKHIKNTDFVFVLAPSNVFTYIEGMPLDISIYSSAVRQVFIRRKNGGFAQDQPVLEPMTLQKGINRLVISRGDQDITFAGILGVFDGENQVTIIEDDGEGEYVRAEFTIIKKPCKKGPYIKWLNPYAGWSYYQFDGALAERSARSTGFINRDFEGLPNTVDQRSELGKESQESLSVVAYGIDQSELENLASLIDSPKVYRFIGTQGAQVSTDDWISESIGSAKVDIDHTNFQKHTMEFRLDKNPRNTIKI